LPDFYPPTGGFLKTSNSDQSEFGGFFYVSFATRAPRHGGYYFLAPLFDPEWVTCLLQTK
jgi:hypothetical protein